jgi:putative tricarboxylic transport membrane protein
MTTGRNLRVGEAILGGGVLALGLFIAVETAQLEVAASNATIGPRLFPFLIATGLIVVGLLVLREAFFGHVAHERGFELDWVAVALVSAGLIAQLLLLETVGWILATTLLFVAVARAFGSRRLLLDAGIGLVLASLAFAIFNYGLGLSLPIGTVIERVLPGGDEDADQ